MLEGLTPLTSFAIAIALIVLLPRLAERLKLPPIIGFILTGFLLGPGVFGLMKPEGPVITLFAELGKVLFMFFVGFEIDLADFRKVRKQAFVFGFLTFLLPFAGGIAIGRLSGSGWNTSVLIGSIIASHTLLSFPLLQKLGFSNHPVVLMVVGGTVFTDIASMLVLAATVAIHLTGFSWAFLWTELLELAVFVPVVIFGAGSLARKAIIRYGQTPEVRMLVMLVVVVICAEGATWINLEGIVGAFLAGIAVKRATRGKYVVEQLDVIAKGLFIPCFLLATGFLLDPKLLGQSLIHHPVATLGLLVAIFGGKFLAAWWTGTIFRQSKDERLTVGSLSLPQMAATLASAVVGFQCVNRKGERLLDASMVNAIVVVVIATCILGPMLTARHVAKMTVESDEKLK